VAFKMDRFILDLPVNGVPTEAHKQIHADRAAVAAENAGKAVPKGNHRAVEHTVRALRCMAADDGIPAEAPYGKGIAGRCQIGRDIFQLITNNFAHNCSSYSKK